MQGIERLGFAEGEDWDWQVFDGSHATFTSGTERNGATHLRRHVCCRARPSLLLRWNLLGLRPQNVLGPSSGAGTLDPTEISAVTVHDEILLAGTEGGEVVQLGLEDGAAMWSHRLDPDSAPSALLLADIDADGIGGSAGGHGRWSTGRTRRPQRRAALVQNFERLGMGCKSLRPSRGRSGGPGPHECVGVHRRLVHKRLCCRWHARMGGVGAVSRDYGARCSGCGRRRAKPR